MQYAEGLVMVVVDMQFDFQNKLARQEFERHFNVGGGGGAFSISTFANYGNAMKEESEQESAQGSMKVTINIIGIPTGH
ncbi:MAG: hypothetical protein ACRC5A_12285, partial [Enterobacteriaceae bacterium]